MVAVALDEKWAIVSGSLVGGRRLVLFRFFQEGHYLFTMLASLQIRQLSIDQFIGL